MSKELSKIDQRELLTLAKSINDREEIIQQLRGKTEEQAQTTVAEAILQGQDLLKAKATIHQHGLWLPWLKSHCPLVKQSQAYVYMKLARNPQISAGGNSIKGALLLCDKQKRQAGAAKSLPEYLQSLYLCSRWTNFVLRHPIDQCPEATRDEMRKELEPVARGLWPDKFEVAM